MTQGQLAERSGLSRTSINIIENGKKSAPSTLIAIGAALGMPAPWPLDELKKPQANISESGDPELRELTSEIEAKLPDKVPVLKGIMRGMLAMLTLVFVLTVRESAVEASKISSPSRHNPSYRFLWLSKILAIITRTWCDLFKFDSKNLHYATAGG
jgi:transcriptional regulator with XRE-family HTH domain